MKVMTVPINKVNSLFEAIDYFEQIINIATNAILRIDFENASFVRNHYLSIIGMGLEIVKNRDIQIQLILPRRQTVLISMRKIGFLSAFMKEQDAKDTFKTMIRYTNIPLANYDLQLQEFHQYFIQQFTGKVANLSPKLLNKILQKILELFSNVFRHSESALGLFCSGQFYPSNEKFNFTIVDNGVTIKTNVNRYLFKQFIKNRSTTEKLFGKKFQSLRGDEAIQWALQDTHSTTGKGGLGLSLLMDFIKISEGSIEIISNDGYYSIKDGIEVSKTLESSFEGTLISIELNTQSNQYYFLQEEHKNANS
ncbi:MULTISPECIES: hypothetical protein [unclassified Sulfurospirillum]|uniref:hypothetical protein n=1 Tax=unclassified Sulfurospirillum TaxID=2618290 RepID=UPI0005053623|nr:MULTISPECIES: hypothetical protein [unclassified Sulfurospirillum]KFL33151.1 hypothetical protein JU57_12780 [Sulfurospirillum sp. SCADC]